MVTLTDVMYARLLSAVRITATRLIASIDPLLFPNPADPQHEPILPLARIDALANSLAWHAARPTHAAQVIELYAEIVRQERKLSVDAPAHQIYQRLRENLGDSEHPSEYVTRVLRLAGVTAQHEPELAAQAQVLLGQALLQALQILQRGSDVRRDIQQQGGALLWP